MEYSDDNFRVSYFQNFVRNSKERIIKELLPLIKQKFRYRKDGELFQKRYCLIFGKDYKIIFKGKIHTRKAIDYGKNLQKLKERIEKIFRETFDTCVVQYYSSGKIGIKRHRDTEVEKNTIIASVSFGETREFVFENFGRKFVFPLEDSSLFLIHPPTNNIWLHSLPPCDVKGWRMSIIFRKTINY